jgi:hypothetical protein
MVDGTQRTPPREPGRRSSSLALSKMMADRGRAWVPMDAVATGGLAGARARAADGRGTSGRRFAHPRDTFAMSAGAVEHTRRAGASSCGEPLKARPSARRDGWANRDRVDDDTGALAAASIATRQAPAPGAFVLPRVEARPRRRRSWQHRMQLHSSRSSLCSASCAFSPPTSVSRSSD